MDSDIPTNEQAQHPESSPASGSIWGAIILIGLGVIFLAQQVGGFEFRNWWALFILIPALGAFGSAFGIYRSAGRFTYGVWATLYGGFFPLLVALMFLFNLSWGIYWPLFVILPGLGMLVNGLPIRGRDDGKPSGWGLHRPWLFMIGLSAILLGVTFVLSNMGALDPSAVLPGQNWWGNFILLPALGGLAAAALLLIRGQSIVLVTANLIGAAVVALAGVIALLGLDWNLMNIVLPIVLILAGIGLLMGFMRRDQSETE